ncbi:MAG: DUF2029 domain-containing protein [Candidatus Eremiobacteraeota bacterium]|nr:DUF2029 domain-containing protein [Candidatus Eremiobacteraeota bacterium]MBC5803722.1 DUF2029 domain-containing protein [Candidatus Eremiobacteraeota bacterium]MBC5822441.1 DUF2029 domain-containing protein [Candidatus Eremiobacteraeota bacterium]
MRPPSTPGPALRDFESYYAAGVTWRYEGDPYGRDVWRTEKDIPGVVATRDELLPFVGPPFGLPLWSALARLPWNAAVDVWRGVLVLSFGAVAFGSLRLAGGASRAFDLVAVTVMALGFGPLTSAFALGQVALFSTAAIVIIPQTLELRFGAIAATFIAALIAALQPNLATVLIARLGGARTWIAFAGMALVALCGSALALGGPLQFARYVDVLRAHGAAERFIAIQTTPGAVARAFGAAPRTAGFIALACGLLVIVGIAMQWIGRRYTPNARMALACAALPLALPFAHEHDFSIAFLPAVMAIRRARGWVWALSGVAVLLAGTDWLGLAQRPSAAAQTALLTLAAALGLAVLAPGRLGAYQAVPALVPFAVIAAGTFAAAHPLPVWPDALGGSFHASATMSAPALWRLEQVRSGIGRLEPAWGVLRLFSLVGCGLLWLGGSLACRSTGADRPAAGRSRREGRAVNVVSRYASGDAP